MSNLIRGQWTGSTNSGSYAIANVNVDGFKIYGRVSEYETVEIEGTSKSYWTYSIFNGDLNKTTFKGQLTIQSVHYPNGVQLNQDELNELIQKAEIEYPNNVSITGQLTETNQLTINSVSTFPSQPQRNETIKLTKPAKKTSAVTSEHMTWDQFKEFALTQKDGLIYRGQAKGWPLQTSFHRTGYADLHSYLDNEVSQLEHHVNAISNHPYNIHEDRSLGALLNLAQHHGYPTPLLDWTKSPYVAAFFAFENRSELRKDGQISIFIFDDKKWTIFAGKNAPMRSPHIVVSTLELPSFNNPRVIPQQALVMFSNINDIEQIIQNVEKSSEQYLRRITIDVSEAEKAMRDLKLMGLTWGSLFPGFDGLCKQLKWLHFN